jgi:pSer/pThr/pTyr-binding forkhead associated (FHA) protein
VLCPDDRRVSKLHARVFIEKGEVYIEDLDSKNGTFVRIDGEAPLQHSDYVFLGSELMRVEING